MLNFLWKLQKSNGFPFCIQLCQMLYELRENIKEIINF